MMALRAANTTLDTSLLRLVVLLYCKLLRASSQTQIFDLLGRVSRSKALDHLPISREPV